MGFESRLFSLINIHPNVFNLVYKKSGDIVENAVVKLHKKQKYFNREFKNLTKLDGINMVPKVIAIQRLYIVLTKYPGYDLMDWLITKKYNFKEDEIKHIIKQLLHIVYNIHSRDVVHRDIKPENIIYDGTNVYLIDFDQKITPRYTAPELLQKKNLYIPSIDAWSIGVVCYILLSQHYPWRKNSEVLTKNYSIITKKCSVELLNFIDNLLTKNPNKRMTISEALQHPWINNKYVINKQ